MVSCYTSQPSVPMVIIVIINVVYVFAGKSVKEDKGTAARVVMFVTFFLCLFSPVTFVMKLVKHPTDHRSVLSLLPETTTASQLCRALGLVYQFYAVFVISASLWFTVATVTVFLRTLISIIRTLR